MSYEKVAMADSAVANPAQPMAEMREERVVDPYRSRTSSLPAPANTSSNQTTPRVSAPLTTETGQPAINSEPGVSTEESSGAPQEETLTLSPQVAALARKEQKFRQREIDLKKQTQSLETERAEIAELRALKAKLQQKDYSGIEDLVSYDDYTKYLIEKDSNLTPEQLALKKLSTEIESVKARQQEDVSKRFEAAVRERREAVNSLIQSNPEFSSIKELKQEEAVVQHILDSWEFDNIELKPEEAAKEVEQELIERAKKWNQLSKLKSQLDPSTSTPGLGAEGEKKLLPPLKPAVKTLTNNMAAMGETKRPLKSFHHMSDQERYSEARRRAEEKLKAQSQLLQR